MDKKEMAELILQLQNALTDALGYADDGMIPRNDDTLIEYGDFFDMVDTAKSLITVKLPSSSKITIAELTDCMELSSNADVDVEVIYPDGILHTTVNGLRVIYKSVLNDYVDGWHTTLDGSLIITAARC